MPSPFRQIDRTLGPDFHLAAENKIVETHCLAGSDRRRCEAIRNRRRMKDHHIPFDYAEFGSGKCLHHFYRFEKIL